MCEREDLADFEERLRRIFDLAFLYTGFGFEFSVDVNPLNRAVVCAGLVVPVFV